MNIKYGRFSKYGIKRSWRNLWLDQKGFIIDESTRMVEDWDFDGNLLIPEGVVITVVRPLTLKLSGKLIINGGKFGGTPDIKIKHYYH